MKITWPEELKGVFHGGCIARGKGSRFRAKAHTHIKGRYLGWICFLSHKRLLAEPLVIHELAHLYTKEGHTPKWRAKVLELGGTLREVPGLLRSYEGK